MASVELVETSTFTKQITSLQATTSIANFNLGSLPILSLATGSREAVEHAKFASPSVQEVGAAGLG
jgi:hypothetical protein